MTDTLVKYAIFVIALSAMLTFTLGVLVDVHPMVLLAERVQALVETGK